MSTLALWTVEDCVREWRAPRRTVNAWFAEGRVSSASRIGRAWVCPAGTKKPDVAPRGRPKGKKPDVAPRGRPKGSKKVA